VVKLSPSNFQSWKICFFFLNLEETFFAAKSMKFIAVYLSFKNKQFVIVKKCSEFVVTVKNDLFGKIHKICNFLIFIINLQFLDISDKKI